MTGSVTTHFGRCAVQVRVAVPRRLKIVHTAPSMQLGAAEEVEHAEGDQGFPETSAGDDVSILARSMSQRMSAVDVPVAGLEDQVKSISAKVRAASSAAVRDRLLRAAAMRLVGAANRELARRRDPRRWHAMLRQGEPTTAAPRYFLVDGPGNVALAARGYRSFGRVMGRQLASLPLAVLAWVLTFVAVRAGSIAYGCAAAVSYVLWFLVRSWLRRAL